MCKKIFGILSLLNLLFLLNVNMFAQFPPAAGQEGSTAIHKDSSVFIGWAVLCSVNRGYMDISLPDSGYVSYGEVSNALGMADNVVLSLGDGGSATLGFHVPIYNGEGFDFCVFENSLNDTFLELAFVEVSSDGINFFRFPSTSLTQTEIQTDSFGSTMPEEINNLAGKYRYLYGTPFDLEEMKNISGLDVDSITQIRIVDVVGCIHDDYATFDSQGNKVNDPWPSQYVFGGFDLDAVGVIHNLFNQDIAVHDILDFKAFPNPVENYLTFRSKEKYHIELFTLDGKKYFETISANCIINMETCEQGVYILRINDDKRNYIRKIVKQ